MSERDAVLERDFFAGPTVQLARELIGYRLVREEDGLCLVGRIVETEAYTQDDPAFHGWGLWDRETGELIRDGRGAALFGPPGNAYVYLCYGIHWLFNVVTEPEGTGGAVLVRAVEPVAGIDRMRARRGADRSRRELTNGPGKLSEALGIDDRFHGCPLDGPELYFEAPVPEDGGGEAPGDENSGGDARGTDEEGGVSEFGGAAASAPTIATSTRVGISKGVEREWRFFAKDHPFVSRGTPSGSDGG